MKPYAIKAITFDAGHTLLKPHPSVGAVYRETMLKHGLDFTENALESGFKKAFATVSKDASIADGELREKRYWRHIVETTLEGLQPEGCDFEAMFEELWNEFGRASRWKPLPGAEETLSTLKQTGYRLAVLSNWDSRARRVIDDLGLGSFFERIFISSEVGYEKPDPRIFRLAAEQLAVAPSELLHVGDSHEHDLAGALSAGCQAAILESSRQEPNDGCLSIRKLEDLIPLFASP